MIFSSYDFYDNGAYIFFLRYKKSILNGHCLSQKVSEELVQGV